MSYSGISATCCNFPIWHTRLKPKLVVASKVGHLRARAPAKLHSRVASNVKKARRFANNTFDVAREHHIKRLGLSFKDLGSQEIESFSSSEFTQQTHLNAKTIAKMAHAYGILPEQAQEGKT